VIRDGNDFMAMPGNPPETLEKGLCATDKIPTKLDACTTAHLGENKQNIAPVIRARRKIAISADSTMCNTYQTYIFGFENFSCNAP
jgi:hypothetical protein